MNQERLTFCIPSFGQATFLIDTLESIRAQTIPCRAVICYGGSVPPSIRDYCAKIEEIELHCLDPDPGMVACWNETFRRASTEFTAFLADDNTVQPNYAEAMIRELDNAIGADFIFCDQNHMHESSHIDQKKTEEFQSYFGRNILREGLVQEGDIEKLIVENSIPLEATIFRSSYLQDKQTFALEAKGAFDIEFIFRLLADGAQCYYKKAALMNFRWHDNAYSAKQRQEHLRGTLWSYRQLADNYKVFSDVFSRAHYDLEARELRYAMPLKSRLALTFRLLRSGRISPALRQNLARILNRS